MTRNHLPANSPLPFRFRGEESVLQALSENILFSPVRHVVEFEWAFAAFHRFPWAVAVSNRTAALHPALHALCLGPGDEV